jgi:hypothetical protein
MHRILTRQFGKELPSFPGAKDHNLDKGTGFSPKAVAATCAMNSSG